MTKTYLQLAREIATLQAAADKQLAAEKNEAVARLNEVIAKYDLSAADLKFPGTGPSVAKPGPKVKPSSKSAISGAKYADGTGNTWGGRGPRPAWLRHAIAAGKRLESFSASVAPAAVRVSTPALGSATAAPAKKSGFTVAPKYRHPGTGDTWSGRGSAPRWLKEALRKRGTKLDDFLIAKPTAAVSSGTPAKAATSVAASKPKAVASTKSRPKPVASAKAAPVKAPAAKKAVTSKASPKSAPAAKKPVAKKSAKASAAASIVAPTKTPAAKRQTAAAPQRVATKTTSTLAKPARKAVAAKKKPSTTSAPAASASVSSTAAPSVSSSASETPANSSVV